MTEDQSTPARDNGDSPGRGAVGAVSGAERWRMIAEAAYYRARARGFQGGNPGEDWRAAEAEIDRRLAEGRDREPQSARREDEQGAYQRLREELQRRLAGIRGTVDAKAVQDAFERATVQVRRAGDYAGTTVGRAAERLKKEMRQTAATMGPRWQEFSGRAAGVFSVWRDRGAEFLARAASGVADWLNRTGARGEAPEYRAGGAVAPGSYQCARCGGLVDVESPGLLPVCPSCQHTEFRRVP